MKTKDVLFNKECPTEILLSLPCIDCITLPICKSLYNRFKKDYYEAHPNSFTSYYSIKYDFVLKLTLKCDAMKEYLSEEY
jgi:hypothetical protein